MNKGGFFESLIYQRFLTERDEIMKYKWLESEKRGQDIGFDRALIEWTMRHRTKWINSIKNKYYYTFYEYISSNGN
jgi:hypothetical protein